MWLRPPTATSFPTSFEDPLLPPKKIDKRQGTINNNGSLGPPAEVDNPFTCDPFVAELLMMCLWVPELQFLVASPCAEANCGGTLNLDRREFLSNPIARTVYTFGGIYFMFTLRCPCTVCDKRFLLTDPRSIAKLPLDIQLRFPAIYSANAAMDRKMFQLMEILSTQMGPEQIIKAFGQLVYIGYDEIKAKYLGAYGRMLKSSLAVHPGVEVPFPAPKFPDFNGPDYPGSVPGSEFIKHLDHFWLGC